MFDVIFWIVVVPLGLMGAFMIFSFIVGLINPKTRKGTMEILKEWFKLPSDQKYARRYKKTRKYNSEPPILGTPWHRNKVRRAIRKRKEQEDFDRWFNKNFGL